MMQEDDGLLVERIRAGDRTAETTLIDRYSMGVWAILARWRVRGAIDAEDLFQETWAVVIRKIRNGEVETPQGVRGFIATTARFVLNGAYRREKIRQHESLSSDVAADAIRPHWMRVDARFRARLVKQFLREIGEARREILFMYFLSEHSRDEICSQLGITHAQLSRRLYEAKAAFREFLRQRMPSLEDFDD